MRLLFLTVAIVSATCCLTRTVSATEPADTVRIAEEVLGEQMAIPAKQIPKRLLDEAYGIVIVPNVIKIGFIAGARRGHGVMLVRDADGEWSLPQFVTLTGGSVGWQAGIQGTDVVLVFTTRKGVDGLLRGKFTIGLDASATAGPVGRELAAGTDSTLQSEVLSYSRSRGLFVGVSLDGSALEVDNDAHNFFYASPSSEIPRRVPPVATQLQHFVSELSPKLLVGPAVSATPIERQPIQRQPSRRLEVLRRLLIHNSAELQTVLNPEWRPYLAMPRELQDPLGHPTVESVHEIHRKFKQLAESREYEQLVRRPEFENTYEVLTEYYETLTSIRPAIQLPAPPHQEARRGF